MSGTWNLSGGTQGDTLGRTNPPNNSSLVYKAKVDPATCWKKNSNGKAYFGASFGVSRGEHIGKGAGENFYLPIQGESAEATRFKTDRISWLVQAFLPGVDLTAFDPAMLPQISGHEGVMFCEHEKNEESGKTYCNLTPIRQKNAQDALSGRYHPRMGMIGDPAPVTPGANFAPTAPPAPVAAVQQAAPMAVAAPVAAAPAYAAAPVAAPVAPAPSNGIPAQQQPGLEGLFNNMP